MWNPSILAPERLTQSGAGALSPDETKYHIHYYRRVLPDLDPSPPPQVIEPPRFESFLHQPRERRALVWRRRILLAGSLTAHGLLLAVGAVTAFWHVDTLTPPAVAVTFLTVPVPPPPPPPAAARKSATPKPRVQRPRPLVQPPTTQPPPAPEPESQTDGDEGAEDGLEGGTPNGLAGGTGAPAPGPTEAERQSLLQRYLRELFRTRIAARFRYPPEAERDGIEGLVVMRVAIDATGRLTGLRLVGACAHQVLCEAASRTLLASAPFPPPPAELGGSIAVDVPLAYRLE
jgi:protein TonB